MYKEKMKTLRITIIYAITGGLGIWFSDKLIYALAMDGGRELITYIHAIRGVLLIISSVCIICFLIRRSEKAIRESERRLRTLINSIPDCIWFKDGEGRLREINDYGL